MSRVLQTVVGLRPFRSQGYRLESETIGIKSIVHNYGHGGAGITLSWGTSSIAADMAINNGHSKIAILGSGVMGLTTALILAEKGANVTLYAADFPPHTTSNIAAALWFPASYYDNQIADRSFLIQDKQIIRYSFNQFLTYLTQPTYGVFWNNHHLLLPQAPEPLLDQYEGNELYPELSHTTSNNLFGYAYQKRMRTLMIDPSIYLERIMQDAKIAGVKFKQKRFETCEQVLSLTEKVIVNCTGLGAKTLFNDSSMTPVQGQLTHLLPQPEIDYSYVIPVGEDYLYMFPRKDAIVLGGTAVTGVNNTEPNEQRIKQMVEGHAELAKWLSI
jgi:glycine/D-amino acid oxidase-like deaminating enzyme